MPHHQTCIQEGCMKISSFNYKGLKRQYCSFHKLSDMVNVKHKTCIHPNCDTIAIFNVVGNKTPLYCSLHKDDNMINISKINALCKHETCNKEALYNIKGSKNGVFCSDHKSFDMIDIRHNRCLCGLSLPCFNYINKPARFCAKCKENDMIVIGKKCINDNCNTTSTKKFKGYCAFCFQHLFPDDPLTSGIHKKTKEIAVRNFLNTKFDGFIHDKPMWTGNCDCSHRRRIDHRKLIGNTLLCIETDEKQHKYYENEDEKIRYDDLYMLHGGKFIFIRFNPDNYVNINGTKKTTCMSYRLKELEQEIYIQMERINNEENTDLLEIHYLFYDGYNYTS